MISLDLTCTSSSYCRTSTVYSHARVVLICEILLEGGQRQIDVDAG